MSMKLLFFKSWFVIVIAILLLLPSFIRTHESSIDEEVGETEGSNKVEPIKESVTEKPVKSEEFLYDEEEFVGYDLKPQKKEANKEKVPQTPSSPEIPLPPPRTNYYLEIVYISFIVAYIVNYFVGKRKNEQIATSWASSVSKAFQSNFSKVGEGKNIGIVKESQHIYKLKATGRINCIGVQATLQLRKRHDLFSIVTEIFSPGEDVVIIDILMNDESMDTFVFALIRKKDEKKFRKSVTDVSLFAPTSVGSIQGIPSSFVACSEAEELVGDLLNPEAQALITKYENLIKRFHFSDQGLVSNTYKRSLQFVFNLPANDHEMEDIQILTRLAFYYIDLVAKVILSKSAKQKTTNNRIKVLEKANKETNEQRHEAAQQRKIQKIQKQKEKMENLSPEQQQKAEEKMRQKEMKKRMPKFKVS